MAEREERRFVELPRDSLRLMAESAGLDLSDEVAALLAEDVCYRLREAAQNSAQFLKHTRRRKLTAEDFNRALRWSNVQAAWGFGWPEAPGPREAEAPGPEEREVALGELALATNIPKGAGQTLVRVQVSYLDGKGNVEPQGAARVSALTPELLQYYQQVTRAVLGDDPQLMKVALQDLQSNAKIAALLPYFVYVVSGVKSVSHDLEQLHRLLHVARSLTRNPLLALGPYARSLAGSALYCALEPLAASINPLNDHWTLRDYAAMLLAAIFWTHGDLVSGLYQQILLALQKVLADPVRPLCSHYGAVVALHALGWKAVERVLYPHLPTYWANLQAVLDDYSVSNAQVKADGHKVYGAILVAVERLLKAKARQPPRRDASPPRHSPPAEAAAKAAPCGAGAPSAGAPAPSLRDMYRELYDFFGDSLAARFGTGAAGSGEAAARKEAAAAAPVFGAGEGPAMRKMPQLTSAASPGEEEAGAGRSAASHRAAAPARPRGGAAARQAAPQRPAPAAREVFQKCRFSPRGAPRFSFVIAGRQAGRRCQGRLFQTSFAQHHGGAGHVSRYAQKLPMIGRTARPGRRWPKAEYSLLLLL